MFEKVKKPDGNLCLNFKTKLLVLVFILNKNNILPRIEIYINIIIFIVCNYFILKI